MIITKYKTQADWLSSRLGKITGSMAATLMGDGYNGSNEFTVYQELKNPKLKHKEHKHFEFGKKLEPLLASMFGVRYPKYAVEHHDCISITSELDHRIQASLDGIVTDKKTGEKGVLEIKTITLECNNALMKKKTEDLSKTHKRYYWQVLHYLLVTGFSYAFIDVYKTTKCINEECMETPCNYREFPAVHMTYKVSRSNVSVAEDIERLKEKELSLLYSIDHGRIPKVSIAI